MSNSIFDMLKLLNSLNQTQQNQQSSNNSASQNFPSDVYSQNNTNQQSSNNNSFSSLTNDGNNSLLPLLMSMLGKSNDLNKIFTQNTINKEENAKTKNSPKDEILL